MHGSIGSHGALWQFCVMSKIWKSPSQSAIDGIEDGPRYKTARNQSCQAEKISHLLIGGPCSICGIQPFDGLVDHAGHLAIGGHQ